MALKHDGITYIHYYQNGEVSRWGISAHPHKDTSKTLKAHLAKWMPQAKFIKATHYNKDGLFMFEYNSVPDKSYQAAQLLTAHIAYTIATGSRHWRTKDGRLMQTLDEVVRAILDNNLEVTCIQK